MSHDVVDRVDSTLVNRLCGEIRAYLREEKPAVGDPLTERGLAERLKVSRSPVRTALLQLVDDGFVERTASGRYRVARSGDDVGLEAGMPTEEDQLYVRLAEDRVDGRLPERVSEAALTRRYGVTRTAVSQTLNRIAREGWALPLPGYGWEFPPVVTSLESYQASYRFRLLVEPAAVLEPTFVLDRTAIELRRGEQQELVDGAIHRVSPATHFELNARFHESLIECSRNEFFIESLARINHLRRLLEYRQRLEPERAVIRCREHVELADLVLAGDRDAASGFLRTHLDTVAREKNSARPTSAPTSTPSTGSPRP